MISAAIPPPRQWLIFSALDEALLQTNERRSLEYLLTQLERHGVPVILNSSLTPRELASVAEALQLDAPRVAEEGSLISYPRDLRTRYMGLDYDQICQILDDLREQHVYCFRGFHDWTAEEIAVEASLNLAGARKARQRRASELLLWQDSAERLQQFALQLRQYELDIWQCERFIRVSARTGKANAMRSLHAEYAQQWGYKPFIIAIGNQPDDQAMLLSADIAIIVRNEAEAEVELPSKVASRLLHVIRTQQEGSAGWQEGVRNLLSLVSLNVESDYIRY